MIYGYARCSTNEDKQDIQRQVRELKQAGAEQIFLEYEHGDSVVKEQLASLLDEATAGDTISTFINLGWMGFIYSRSAQNEKNTRSPLIRVFSELVFLPASNSLNMKSSKTSCEISSTYLTPLFP